MACARVWLPTTTPEDGVTPKPDFSILLLTYNRGAQAAKRVGELERYVLQAHPATDLVVFDNGSRSGLPVDLAMACQDSKQVLLAHFEENLGFGPGFNWVAQNLAKGRNFVFLSDDVEVYGDFIPRLTQELEATPTAFLCKEVVNWRAGWNVFGDTVFSYPQGYFLACSRQMWEEFGGFDPQFSPAGYEDVDLGYRIQQEGLPLIGLPDLPVRHTALADDRMEKTIALRRLFARKWGLPNIPERP
jgi:GT2 family glycosyltransferase